MPKRNVAKILDIGFVFITVFLIYIVAEEIFYKAIDDVEMPAWIVSLLVSALLILIIVFRQRRPRRRRKQHISFYLIDIALISGAILIFYLFLDELISYIAANQELARWEVSIVALIFFGILAAIRYSGREKKLIMGVARQV